VQDASDGERHGNRTWEKRGILALRIEDKQNKVKDTGPPNWGEEKGTGKTTEIFDPNRQWRNRDISKTDGSPHRKTT